MLSTLLCIVHLFHSISWWRLQIDDYNATLIKNIGFGKRNLINTCDSWAVGAVKLIAYPFSCYKVWHVYTSVPTKYICITLPKAQQTRGLSSTYQNNFFGSYHKFKHKSWSKIFRISTKHQLQNLNQINISISTKLKTLKSWPNLASESRPRLNFITKTKHQ